MNDAGEVHIPRFNEQIDIQSVKKSQGPQSIISHHSKKSSRSIVIGQQQRPQTSSTMMSGNYNRNNQRMMNMSTSSIISKQKILEAVEKLSEKDLEKFSKMLKVDNA